MTDRNLHDFYILLAFLLAYGSVLFLGWGSSDPITAVLVLWLGFGIPVAVMYSIHVGRRHRKADNPASLQG